MANAMYHDYETIDIVTLFEFDTLILYQSQEMYYISRTNECFKISIRYIYKLYTHHAHANPICKLYKTVIFKWIRKYRHILV